MVHEKMKNNIDYHVVKNGIPTHYINWQKYNCEKQNWKTLEELFHKYDFLDLLYVKLRGTEPNEKEKNLFLKTIFISSMGIGHHPPSVMIPKLIASVTKNKEFAIINGIAGGINSYGTDHLGAIVGIMKIFEELKKESNLEKSINDYVEKCFLENKKVKGFGHPVYKEDSRPKILEEEVKKTYENNVYIKIYSNLKKILFEKKEIHPNIDSALALSYSSMGFEPEQGIYFSIISRSLSMLCHILEEFPKKPFDFLNQIIPEKDL